MESGLGSWTFPVTAEVGEAEGGGASVSGQCHGTCVKVRGQLMRVNCSFLYVGSRDGTQVVGLDTKPPSSARAISPAQTK